MWLAALCLYVKRPPLLGTCETPTVGDLCKSFQLRIPIDDVLKGCDAPEPYDCAHLAEKYGIPTGDGHCVTRDFEWLPRYSQGTNPQAPTQNLKNALLPQWHHNRDRVHSGLRRSLRDLPILGNKDHLSLSVMAAIQSFYGDLLTNTPRTHHLSHVKKQLRQLPSSWVTGWLDKGTSALCAGCKNFWYPRFKKAFFQPPKRFSELLRTPTPADASEQAFRYIVSGAKSFLPSDTGTPDDTRLQPDLCARLRERVENAREGVPEKYHMSREFVDTWRQALNECDTKLKRYVANTMPPARCPTPKSNRGFTKGLKGPYRLRNSGDTPPLIEPLFAPLLPNPTVCTHPPVYAGPATQDVAISGPVVLRDLSEYVIPHVHRNTSCDHRGTQRVKALPAPNCQLLLKYKSQESAAPPGIKIREVLTYACHPFQKLCKLMGRALTLLWKTAVDVLGSRELIAMPHMVHTVKKWLSQVNTSQPAGAGMPFWTEMDVKEMFPEIPK